MEPWEKYPEIWKTESSFFVYLRGHLRNLWQHYPAKIVWKKSQMVKPPVGYTGRAKSLGRCTYCDEWFAASNLEVDHITQAGSCNSWETSNQFLHNLLNCNDNWCLACTPCHKIKSYSERTGLSFDDAALQKDVILIMKQPTKEIQEFISSYGDFLRGNSKERKESVLMILSEYGNK